MFGEELSMNVRGMGLAISLLALVGGCGVSFEAQLQDVQISRRNLKVQGVPSGFVQEGAPWEISFTISSEEMAWAKRMNSEVRVHRIWIAASEDSVNLDFIRQLRISVADSATPTEAVQLVLVDRPASPPNGGVIASTLTPPVDITTAWNASRTLVSAQLSGQLPELDWLMDLSLTVSGKITDLD
jgi:hypothetical protein